VPVRVRDPIHGTIELEAWAVPLVDAPTFQRLRRVHQLGTAHLVYPGAHHRRFEHGLGASHVAGRMAASLGLPPHDAATLRAAALLHDVGHGPFSHAYDELLREEGRRHEEMSVDLVRWGPLADLLRQGGLDPVAVSDAILGKGALAPLVAGTLDADRIDYLLRDAHYTGVPSSVDADRLTEVLRRDAHGILLDESGQTAAEALLTMRFLMYPAVYLHHTVRASESMLQGAIRAHVADAGLRSVRAFERDTDDTLLATLRAGSGAAADLVRRLDERRLHKRALEVRADTPLGQAILPLADRPADRARLAREIAEAAGVPAHHVLLDVPRPPRFREAQLRIATAAGPRPLAEASQIVRVLQEARLDHWRAWVFAPKADRDAVGKAAQSVLGSLAS